MASLQSPQESFNDTANMSYEQQSANNASSVNFPVNTEDFSFTEDIKPFIGGGRRSAYQCNICNKLFISLKGLQQHAVIHTDRKPFECEVCGRLFRFKSNLFEHKSVHSNSTAHACPYCDKTCRLKGNLKKHLKTHVSTPEELAEAWKPFASNRRPPAEIPANAVIVRSNGYKTFDTPKQKLGLGQTATTWLNKIKKGNMFPTLSVEKKLEHFLEALNILKSNDASLRTVLNKARMIAFESFECPICAAAFNSRRECSEHLDLEHPLARVEQPLFCEICLKAFDDRKALDQHESYHKRVHLLVEKGDLELTDPELMDINGIPSNALADDDENIQMDQKNSSLPHDQSADQTQNPLQIEHGPSESIGTFYDEQNSMNQVQTSDSVPVQENPVHADDGQLF